MTHRGYTAAVESDADDHVFVGRLVGLRDVVHFETASVGELEAAMREAVDDYLAFCEEQGRDPEPPLATAPPLDPPSP